jgi:hypothetical protein
MSAIPWNQSQSAAQAADIDKKSATFNACILSSISLKEIIPPQVLVNILKGLEPLGDWEPYIGVFFGECPAKIIHGVVKENGLTKQNLDQCYQSLPVLYQTPHFEEVCPHVFAE